MTAPVGEAWQFEILDGEGYLLCSPDGRRYAYADPKILLGRIKNILGIDDHPIEQPLPIRAGRELSRSLGVPIVIPEVQELLPGASPPTKDSLTIPGFTFDRALAKTDGRHFSFVEMADGRIALKYFASWVYTTLEKLASLPSPLPRDHLQKMGFSPNARAAIKRYIALQRGSEPIISPRILIPKFEYDRSLMKSLGKTSYAELPDGRVALKYGTCYYYTTGDMLSKLPWPLPRGYLRDIGAPTNAVMAIKAYLSTKYREKETPEPADTPEPKMGPPLPIGIMPFREIDRFVYAWSLKVNVGDTYCFHIRDKVAVKMMGSKETVFTTKEKIRDLLKLTPEEVTAATRELSAEKRRVLVNFINNLKDQPHLFD